MRGLRVLTLLSLAALLLAGCSSNKSPSSPSAPGSPQPALAGGWTLDCGLGAPEHAINASWEQRCVARGSHTPGSKEEMWAAVNPKDPLNAVVGAKDLNPASSPGCVWNGLAVTKDGGKTWKDVVIGGAFAARTAGDPFWGYRCNTDPDFRFDLNGDLHYGVEMYDFGAFNENTVPVSKQADQGYKILLATSHDGGLTWPEVVTYQPDLVVVTDYSRMQISPTTGTAIEAIGSEGGVGCNVLRWSPMTPDNPTFEPVVTKDGIPCNSGGGSGVAVSPTGTVVLIGAAGVVARSTDDGVTFADSNPLFTWKGIPGTFKESKYRITNNVESAYDWTKGPNRGVLYATYAAAERGSDLADIYVRSSKDDGRTWSEPVLVNHDPAGSHQWMPGISVAGDGSVHIAYMDKSYDPGHKLIDITHAVSLDGGKTWATERVTSKSFDGDLGVHQEGFPFIGDYLGIDCVGDDCWMGFPDSSMGEVPVIAAAHSHRAA
jgi:hypothetical protein